jgi:hypothetical protein
VCLRTRRLAKGGAEKTPADAAVGVAPAASRPKAVPR